MLPIRRFLHSCAAGVAAIALLSAAENGHRADLLKARFVDHVSAGMNDFRVCEAYSKKDDKRAFFKKALGVDAFAGARAVESREIFVEEPAASRKAHLGILVLLYADAKAAQQTQTALAKQGEYFKGSEVLTKFKSGVVAESLFVVYTETVLNERVASFLDKIPAELREIGKANK